MHICKAMVASIVLLVFAMTSAGCLAVAAAAGAGAGVAYMRGDLQATVNASPAQAVAASERALESMGIAVLAASADDLEGSVNARTANDRRVRINVKRQTDTTSGVSIRIGTFGDEELSRTIYDRIREQL